MRRRTREEAIADATRELAMLPAKAGGCPLCALVGGHTPSEVLARSEHAVAMLDRYPAREGHVVIATRAHVTGVAHLDETAWLDVQRLAHQAAVALERTLAPRRTFVAALGSDETLPTSFAHVHVHVVPVFETGDDARPAKVLSWSSGVGKYEGDEAALLGDRLRAAWAFR